MLDNPSSLRQRLIRGERRPDAGLRDLKSCPDILPRLGHLGQGRAQEFLRGRALEALEARRYLERKLRLAEMVLELALRRGMDAHFS